MRRHAVLVSIAVAVLCRTVDAQGVITTFAGTDWVFPGDGKPALNAPLGSLTGIAVDSTGNPIIVDSDNCIVASIRPDGVLSVIAGNGICENTGEGGVATSAAIYSPYAAAFDAHGNLFLTNRDSIRRISAGIITTIAGGPGSGFSPAGITTDASGNIYFADLYNHRVRKVAPGGIVSTVAGNGTSGFSGDGGFAISAMLDEPHGVALDQAGNLYIADYNNYRIRRVTPGGTISTVGSSLSNHPASIAFDNAGTMYIGGVWAVYALRPNSTTPSVIAGDPGESGYSGDGGPAINARFRGPLRVAPDNLGNVYIADEGNFRVRKISVDGIITTVAGNGNYRYAGESVPAVAAYLNKPHALALDPAGDLYLSELDGNRIRKVTAGILTTFAGTGASSFSGDGGPAARANVPYTLGMVFDPAGNLYLADGNTRIRKVTPAGIISTFAVLDSTPRELALDSAGNLYASSSDYLHRVLRIDTRGNVTLFAGSGGIGYSGDGGPAIDAMLNFPNGLAVDANGNLLVADSGNHRVRKITPQGIITTFAGNGVYDSTGDSGPATQASISSPYALAFDAAGNLYIGDNNQGLIRRVTPSGIISTFAGGGPRGRLGDGKVATAALLTNPAGLVFDRAGNLYFSDYGANRVRKVLATPPTMRVSQTSLSFSAPSGGAPATQTLAVEGSISGLDFQVAIETGGRGNWLMADATSASTPRLLSITADPTNLAPGAYSATIAITPAAAMPAPPSPVNVTFQVGPALPPKLRIDQTNLSFTFPRGAAARSATIRIFDDGSGTLNVTASTSTVTGGRWISVSLSAGTALPGKPATLTVTADPAGLDTNTYTGSVTIQTDAGPTTIPVTMTISSLKQALLLTQTGMSFTAVVHGGVVPPQSFGVVNVGTGVLSWTAIPSTLSGGNWLIATPRSGASDASAAAAKVTISVDTAGLGEGKYYGLVRIDAPSAANTPHVVTVFLEVIGKDTGSIVQPPELVFPATPGEGPPGSQTLLVYNIGAVPKTFTSQSLIYAIRLTVLPQDGALDPTQPKRVIVQPLECCSGSGTLTGSLTFQFSDGSVQSVRITVISAPSASPKSLLGSASGSSNSRDGPLAGAPCTPTQLLPALTTLGQSFAVSAGWPVALSAEVRDDCGNPHVSGAVTIRFSDGEAPVPLTSLNDGTWQATWPTRSSSQSQVTLTVHAVNPQLQISGTREIDGEFRSLKDPPVFSQNSIISAASPLPFQALAPGSFISIYGDRLAENNAPAESLPLPKEIGGTRVIINDQTVPLYFVSQGQINALVPFGINVNTSHQVLIQRGLTYSQPVPVDMAPAQPSIFLDNGYGKIVAVRNDGTQFVVSPFSPARAGDVLTIYCAGLGVTDQSVADGAPAPSSPLAKTQATVTVTIGGRDAPVLFSGLAPGFTGLYQVNATMPSGVTPGDSAPVTLTVAGQTGPPAYLAVR